MTFHPDRLREAASQKSSAATGLVEQLVLSGVPFREAHEAIGKLVASAEQSGADLGAVSSDDLRAAHPSLTSEMLLVLDVDASVASRDSHGATSPRMIAEQLARIESLLDDEERWLAGFGAY